MAKTKGKKWIALLLAALCLVSAMQVAAAPKRPLTFPNGDFEILAESGVPESWLVMNGNWTNNVFLETEMVHGGKYAIRTVNTGAPLITKPVSFTDLKEGFKYRFGAWCYNEKGGSASLKIDIFGKDPETGEDIHLEKRLPFPARKAWQQQKYEVTIPKGYSYLDVYLCNYSTGETVYFDDATLEQLTPDAPEEPLPPRPTEKVKEPLPGTGELLKNPGFEDGNEHWTGVSGAKWDESTFITEEWVKSGNNALLCEPRATYLIRQEVRDIKAGFEYQASMWVDFASKSANASIRVECYTDNEMTEATYISGIGSDTFNSDGLGWKQIVWNFRAPEGTKMIMVYLKCNGMGTYIDDASFMVVGEAPKIELDTEWVFYYTENTLGTATATANLLHYPDIAGSQVKFDITEKASGKIVDEQLVTMDEDSIAHYTFKTAAMEKKQEEYALNAHLLDKDGNIIETHTKRVFRYDRPKYINDKGQYDDGSGPVDIVTMTAIPDKNHYPRVAAMGATAATVYDSTTWEQLDWLYENGMRAVFILYGGMIPAGHPNKIERTKELVSQFKDHPAVYAWNIMDEGFYHFQDPTDWYIDSYRAVRDLDPNHPVLAVEINMPLFEKAAKYLDVFVTDIYPGDVEDKFGFYEERLGAAMEAMQYQRPVQILSQGFRYGTYVPTPDDMRSYNYQGLFDGAFALGYFCFTDSVDGKYLDETDMAPGIVEWYEKDQADAFAHFVKGELPLFNEYRSEDYWYRTYEKEGKLRTVILNRYTDKEVEAMVELKNVDGSISIGDFTASVYAGGAENNISGSGSFTVTLTPGQAVVYEITPSETVDFSSLPHAKYIDLYPYAWARSQIEILREKGIVTGKTHNTYAPGENVTRGDFAMFLVRALGISGEGENFTDVDPDKEYASALAAGKAAGIINGVGENKFNPEAHISRQDMMTMLGRALGLSGEGMEIGNTFTDVNLVADYALSHVKAVVAKGLIRGNADGTLNPLGNTTRAEAAVIMDRIMNK